MPLVPVKDLLREAERGGYAVGAFNCNNMEIVQAIVQAAEEERAPVIVQASQGAIKYAGLEYIYALGSLAATRAKVPVALHLDHGTDFPQVMRCLRIGFTSVMIDGSKLPLEQNIALTRKVVEVAGAMGVSVEGELGKIGGTEDQVKVEEKDAAFTDPEEARLFLQSTGVDSLAIAIGTAHGVYRGEPRLDFERLRRVREVAPVPIVLHGSSGVPDEAIRQAVQLGVRKVNIDTNVREAFVSALRQEMERNPKEIDPRNLLGPAREAMTALVREKIRVFGSSGRA